MRSAAGSCGVMNVFVDQPLRLGPSLDQRIGFRIKIAGGGFGGPLLLRSVDAQIIVAQLVEKVFLAFIAMPLFMFSSHANALAERSAQEHVRTVSAR